PQREANVGNQLVESIATRARTIAQRAFVAQLGVDRTQVTKGSRGGASCILGRHAPLDEFLRTHLEVKAKLVADVVGGVVAQVGSADDSAHAFLLCRRRRERL